MSRWIYRVARARLQVTAAPTDDEAALAERADYAGALERAGILILASRPQQTLGTWEVTIIEAPDEASARAIMETDPAVAAGVVRATLHPYAVAADASPGTGGMS